MSAGNVNACTPNEWVTDRTYASRDETSIPCYTRILSDTRADFFPEDYEPSVLSVAPAWLRGVCHDDELYDFERAPPPRKTPPRNRLKENEARKILSLGKHKTPETASKLATRYGVSSKAIREIWTGKSWRHLTGS